MATRKLFQDFIQVKNIREGLWVDGKMLTVYFDIVVGPFTFMGASYKWATGSLRIQGRKIIKFKASYHPILKKIIVEAIDKHLKKV